MWELASVFPSLAELAEDPAGGLPDERYRSHRAVGALLELLGGRRPLVLVLDDVHWADDASIELLSHLLRRRPRGRLLLALAYRKHQAPPRLVAALEAADDGELLELRPLSPAEADELLGESLPTAARAELHRESGGNPFYLQALLRADAAGADRVSAPGPWAEGVPRSVMAALRSELGALSPDGRKLLEGAAVVGDPFDPELAGVAADTDEARSLVVLDELIAADLVRDDGAAAPVPLPSPDRATGGVRVGEGGLAARRPPAGGVGLA